MVVSTGVMKSSWWKPQPPATRQANGAPSMLTISCRVSISPGGGGEGGTGGGDGGGGDGGGEGGGGDGGAPGGAMGGGEGASRTEQSSQSWPKAQPAYSLPGPPSSHTPSLAHPCSRHALLQISGGGGGDGGGSDGGGGGGGWFGGDGGSIGDGGDGGGARGATLA